MDESTQPELFDLPPQAAPRRQYAAIGTVAVRHDQAVLLLIVALLGSSVVFAMGVERGKRLARTERPLLPPVSTASGEPASAGPSATDNAESPATPQAPRAPARPAAPGSPEAPAGVKKTAAPKAVAAASAPMGFGVQVVSYSQLKLAHRELQRLKQQGEAAFLITKQDRVVLVIGPFRTKATAATKLARLKERYQGCFIRSL